MKMTMLSKERAYKQVISWTGPNGQHGLQVGERVVRWRQPSEDGRKLWIGSLPVLPVR
jgi:hypothetical protein